jgi:tetratricopeptide (TPR) repeat protein
MNRENILFALVGLLLGYIIAFHLVIYVNQNQPQLQSVQASANEDSSPDSSSTPTDDVKDRERAQSNAEQAAKEAREDPKNFDAQFKAGVSSLEAGDAEGAIDFLLRANQLRPTDYDTLVRLGNANFEANRLDVAERWYKEALQKKPEDVDVRSDLGLIYFKSKPPQKEKAIAELRRALEYDPENVIVLYNLTLVLAQTGDFDGAEATVARLEKLNPDDAAQLRKMLADARRDAQSSADSSKVQKKPRTD